MIVQQDSLEWLKKQEADSIDHIITDPPYLIDFMAKKWDSKDNVAGSVDYWKEALRVCKAGSYALVFGHSRTHHRVMTAMEDAGWEIRDCLMWLYGSGFPKSQNIGKILDKREGKERKIIGSRLAHDIRGNALMEANQPELKKENSKMVYEITTGDSEWEGWGSNLKPAYEPIIMARKPFKGTLIDNVSKNDLGGLNINTCRVGTGGRFPANIILDEEAGKLLDEQSGTLRSGYVAPHHKTKDSSWFGASGKFAGNSTQKNDLVGGASRFFYVAKVSAKERNLGCEDLFHQNGEKGNGLGRVCATCGVPQLQAQLCSCENKTWVLPAKRGNNHPTIKPIELMKWLVKLVSKEGQTILDPFMGSGSTGIAVELLGRTFIGVEMDADYCDIAERRITAWVEKENNNNPLQED